jgi:sugar phosphate isomerase/epimerase
MKPVGISAIVGPGRRLGSIDDYAEFRHALAQHCYEAALIVEAFSREWYSKANWKGGITEARASGFTYVAFKKLREELRRRAANG